MMPTDLVGHLWTEERDLGPIDQSNQACPRLP